MNCPPPSHSMWWVFCCVRAFFWIDYRIIECIGHFSFCKKRDFYDGDSEKNGVSFFFFFMGVHEKIKIYLKKKEKKGVIGI